MPSDFNYGLAGFMDAYQRARGGARGGARGQGKQPDPYVEQERYNKLKRETDDKSADQAYEAIKSLASGGKDPTAIAPPPQMPIREPGNSGFGMQRPGSLGGPSAGGGYGGGPLFGGGMGGGQPLDMNMGPLGIPLGILGGLGQAMGGGKQGAPSGPPQGLAAAAPPSPATAATPPAATVPPSGAAGGPSPLSPTYAGAHPSEMFQPAGGQDQPTGMAAAPSAGADNEPFSISPPPTLKAPDLSRMKEIDQQLAAAGYDEHARNQAKMRFAEEAQKQAEKDYDMAHKQWAADLEYKTRQHQWSEQAATKARQAVVESRNAEKANMEMQKLGMEIVKKQIETQKLLAENGGIPDERTAKLQVDAQRYRKEIAEAKKAYDQAQTRIGAMMSHANALQDDHMKEIAEQQVQAGLKEQQAAQARINMGTRQLKDVNKQLGTDDEPRPEDMPRPPPKPAAPKEEPAWYQQGGALGKLGNYLYGPDTQGMAAAPGVVYDPQGRAMRYKGGPKNDPSSYEPAQ